MKSTTGIGFVIALLTTLQLLCANDLSKRSIRSDECFDEYSERTLKLAHDYAESYEKCQHLGAFRRDSFIREKEAEREQIESGTAQICGSMRYCNTHEAHEDFFNCHAAISPDNLDTLINIHLNASAVVIELSSSYDEDEKRAQLCAIEARRNYMHGSREALNELRLCLDR